MSRGGPMMLPTSIYSASAPNSHVSQLSRYFYSHHNTPEEDDETMSTEEREASTVHKPDSISDPNGHRRPLEHAVFSGDSLFSRQQLDRQQENTHTVPHPASSFCSYQPPRSLPAGYGQPTPFPSQADGAWLHPSFASSWSGYPNSLPSSLNRKDYSGCSGDSCLSGYKFLSLAPWQHLHEQLRAAALSLLQPAFRQHVSPHVISILVLATGSPLLRSVPCRRLQQGPMANKHPWPQYHPAHGPYHPGACRLPGAGYTHIGRNAPAKEKHPPPSTSLSLEQRKVFVTYEADNDKHVNEIINFVALLRHNGFDTHIDIFEQQFRSISKIDFMERYLSEKEYLIIIIISPKYYETVTASPVGLENDERTFNTVYIHKQLQNEFIQNGSKNFRFIPIVFPGAKKCHVPNWLQNTHIYEWPLHRDDILRRLMRVEKYNPPPIGELPTIVSIPI
ncbi:E3 ubiquitin ligase TRAF3IP2 [Plectropomus leopardus]|uniref:E3 ubiquitin ligase TRAF3IP2 n=1 Tax=Plectropomus leopardus TaxID=160734 RepID=UPI001C4C1010|nr:E3 ubiquitin ligase TRAF3IP2 [Plectropomus leopardus]